MVGSFPVKHSILDEDALARWVLSRYTCREPLRCRFYRRSMSDVYRVDTADASYILKVYLHGRHSRPELEAEVGFLADLLGCDVPVAAPVSNKDGECLNEIDAPEGTRYAVLFEAITGDPPRETNLEHSRAFGQLAGRLHRCADRRAGEGKAYGRRHLDERYLIEEPLATLEPYLRHRPADLDYLRGLGSRLAAELRHRLPKAGPEYGMCHGDLHTGNARFDRHGRLTLFDLDSCGYGWRAIDIGVYHVSYDWMNLGGEVRRQKERFWAAFVEGYSAQRSLSDNELIAAQLCLPIRHLELMGVTIRYWSPQEGIHWINDEYMDGHVNWFKEWEAHGQLPDR
jgi:Ser/Thr protein kinase RdoA (MazF antagonist)